MAVATAAALVGTGLATYQTIKSAGDKKKSEKDMANYTPIVAENSYKDMPLSTVGTNIMREESARTIATLTDLAKSRGVRGASDIAKLQAGANKVTDGIAMKLENQDLKRKYEYARDEGRIRDINIQKDRENIAAISSQYNAANQNFNQGIWGMASGAMSTVRGIKTDKENGDWFGT